MQNSVTPNPVPAIAPNDTAAEIQDWTARTTPGAEAAQKKKEADEQGLAAGCAAIETV